jgi:hypothetical protein
MSKIPLYRASDPARLHDCRTALVLTTDRPVPTGFAVIRHADAAAMAQAGSCTCCRVPSGLTQVLRQLFLDRVRGAVEFETVVVAAEDDAMVAEAMSDPLVAARYARVAAAQS